MPTPTSEAHSRDRYLIHAVAVSVGVSSDQAVALVRYQPELIAMLESGHLSPKVIEITRTVIQTTNDYLAKKDSRALPRKKIHIDRRLMEDEDTSDYSQQEGGALQLQTGPRAEQMWFQDLNPELEAFLSTPHPALSS